MSEQSLTSLGQVPKKQDLGPSDEFMQTSNFEQQQQAQQNEQAKKVVPFVFNTYNMPRINCFYHPGQTVTNFCKCSQCLLPLCPECVKEHVNEHSEDKSYPKLDCLENVLTDVHQEVYLQANELVKGFDDIQKSVGQAFSYTIQTMEKLKEAKQRIIKIVDQYFHSLENELENKQKKNYENFKRDANSLQQIINDRWISHSHFLESLKQPDCMYSLLPYLQSPTPEDNQLYIKTAQIFSNRFKEVQSQITFDQAKSSQLSAFLPTIIKVIHFDLPEFLDIHKLAPPEIIKSRVLAVQSQNSKPQSRLMSQQLSNQKKSGKIITDEKLEISQPPILIDPNLIQQTLRYQQSQQIYPNQPQQVVQNQYYSQPQYAHSEPFQQSIPQPQKYGAQPIIQPQYNFSPQPYQNQQLNQQQQQAFQQTQRQLYGGYLPANQGSIQSYY